MQAATAARGAISGKTVIVTGANRGIGLEFARQLLQRPDNTVVAAVRTPTEDLDALRKAHPQCLHVTTIDLASPESICSWAEQLPSSAGVSHVDVVINNAGVYGRQGLTLDNVTAEDIRSVFQVNTIGPLLVAQQLRKRGLLGGGEPSLLANVTSKVGSVDDNRGGGGYAYRASKSALNIVNKSLSIDLAGQGVTCVLLHPGYVRTRMTGGQGLIDVDESVSGMLAVLEGSQPLQGAWYDFAGKVIPW